MRVAVAGKGGSGKTTISGTLARVLAQSGRQVIAVDADTNPNLAITLGLQPDRTRDILALPRTLLKREKQPDGSVISTFLRDPLDVLDEYGTVAPDGVRLIVMGAVGHGGTGCMCGAHATVRGFLGELVAKSPDAFDVIVDMEAGLEHFSRGTGKHVSRFLAVVEPYYRSMETARRVADLAGELGIAEVGAVLNKVRNEADRESVASFCTAHHMSIVGEIPYDAGLADAERAGQPPLDYDPWSASVVAMRRLAADLVAES